MNDPRFADRITIRRQGEAVASLERTSSGSRLSYLPGAARSLNWTWPLGSPPWESGADSAPPFLANLLPEGRRLQALAERVKTSLDDIFSLLAALGSDLAGDLSVGEGPDQAPAIAESGSFRRLYADSLLSPELTPVAGVMPKISAGSALPATLRGRAVIFKVASPEHPWMPLIEKACLDASPLPAAEAEVHQDEEGWWALSSRRFDRTPDGPLHAEDGCQLLDLYPSQKYRTSTEELIRAAMRFASSPAQAGRDLLCLFAYSWLIGGHDLHAKNISLLERDGLVRLSPIYDVVSDFGLGREDSRMALVMLGQDQGLSRASFEALGRELDLPAKAVKRALQMAESGAERLISLLPSSRLPTRISGRFGRKAQARLDGWI